MTGNTLSAGWFLLFLSCPLAPRCGATKGTVMDRYILNVTDTKNSVSSISCFEHVVGVAILGDLALLHAWALSWRGSSTMPEANRGGF
jgi:hypothetical protein